MRRVPHFWYSFWRIRRGRGNRWKAAEIVLPTGERIDYEIGALYAHAPVRIFPHPPEPPPPT